MVHAEQADGGKRRRARALATFVSYVMRWGYFARAVAPDLVANGGAAADADEEEVDIFAQ